MAKKPAVARQSAASEVEIDTTLDEIAIEHEAEDHPGHQVAASKGIVRAKKITSAATFNVPLELNKRWKNYAHDHDTTKTEVLLKLVESFLARKGY
jgi:hypothetical protein